MRQRLHDFYQSYEATLCSVLLTIPVGTHQLQITYREIPPSPQWAAGPSPEVPVAPPLEPQSTKLSHIFGGLSVFFLAMIFVMVYFQLRGSRTHIAEAHIPESQL